ncbi:MAG: hypothetical protein C0392_01375 [Syntrophus sp. (in: bacteria)]|nr:hypothetical protein [Syntrophus sp. (in: bacteria)]
MSKKHIFTLTINPALDKSTVINRVVPEHKLRCKNPVYEPGGGGINVSRAIKKLGGQSTAFFTSGGLTGNMLNSLLKKEGIAHRSVPIGEWTRESLVVLEESTGVQYRFNMEGPSLREMEWEEAIKMVRQGRPKPDYIVGSGLLPPGVPQDFYARLAQVGRNLGARVIIDTSGEPLLLALQGRPFMIKPNLRELGILAGRELQSTSEQDEFALEIVVKGQSDVVVVSFGAAGCLLATERGLERLKAPEVPVMSKVGAGDSMVAGIVVGLVSGKTMTDAVRYGMAAGASAVMSPGSELCSLGDTELLFPRVVPDEQTNLRSLSASLDIPIVSASQPGNETSGNKQGVPIAISLIDRSRYYKGLMLLIRKDHEIHARERNMMMHIGSMLGFESQFCKNAIKEILDNKHIVDSPPYFREPRIALSFIRDGLKLSASDGSIHKAELDWLESVAIINEISDLWTAEFDRFSLTTCVKGQEYNLELKYFKWE